MDYKALKAMDIDEYQEYIEDLSEEELNSLFDELVRELADDPDISSKVYWSDCDYFAFHNGRMYRIPQGADDLPKGGPYPTIISGIPAETKAVVKEIVEKYGEDDLNVLFDQLDDIFLCTYSDYPDYTDEAVLSYFSEEEKDYDSEELVNNLVDDVKKTNGVINSIADLCDKFRRLDLDEGGLYYRYNGEYFDLLENILDVGDDPRDYEEIEEIFEYLFDLEKRVVEPER